MQLHIRKCMEKSNIAFADYENARKRQGLTVHLQTVKNREKAKEDIAIAGHENAWKRQGLTVHLQTMKMHGRDKG